MSQRELDRVNCALEALSKVTSMKQYEAAKRVAAKCSVENQFALVDSLIAARKRARTVA